MSFNAWFLVITDNWLSIFSICVWFTNIMTSPNVLDWHCFASGHCCIYQGLDNQYQWVIWRCFVNRKRHDVEPKVASSGVQLLLYDVKGWWNMNIIMAKAVYSSNSPDYTFFSELNNMFFNSTFFSNIVTGKLFLNEKLFML